MTTAPPGPSPHRRSPGASRAATRSRSSTSATTPTGASRSPRDLTPRARHGGPGRSDGDGPGAPRPRGRRVQARHLRARPWRRRCAPTASRRSCSKAACAAGSGRCRRARWSSASPGLDGPSGPASGSRLPLLRARRRRAGAGRRPGTGRRRSTSPWPHELGARVTDVVDTHLHADHLSGARDARRRTPAPSLRLPARALERGVRYPVEPLHDGDAIALGRRRRCARCRCPATPPT